MKAERTGPALFAITSVVFVALGVAVVAIVAQAWSAGGSTGTRWPGVGLVAVVVIGLGGGGAATADARGRGA